MVRLSIDLFILISVIFKFHSSLTLGDNPDSLIANLLIVEELSGRPVPKSCQWGHNVSVLPWKLPYMLDITHIPKTGGTTFHFEALAITQIVNNTDIDSQSLLHSHKCYGWKRFNNLTVEEKRSIWIRSPGAHVASMFAQCQMKKYRNGFRKTDRIDLEFLSFIHEFTNLQDTSVGQAAAICMDPRDMNTRFLTCDSDPSEYNHERYTDLHPFHARYPPPNLHEGLLRLNEADFVGVTDLYTESICLLEALVVGKLSERCTCNPQHNTALFVHEDHDAPHVPHKVIVEDLIVNQIKKRTPRDTALFKNGLLRVLCDIRAVEQFLRLRHPSEPLQHRIICDGVLSEVMNKVSYVY